MKALYRLLSIGLMAGLLAAACGGAAAPPATPTRAPASPSPGAAASPGATATAPSAAPAATPTRAAAQPTPTAGKQPQGTLIVAVEDMVTEDVRSYNWLGAVMLTYLTLFSDGAFRLGPDGKRMNSLATGFSYSSDGKTLTLDLRQGVKFQNGDPFTAEDVRFTVQKALDFRPGELNRRLQAMRILNDYRIAFDFDQPTPSFLESGLLLQYQVVPSKYFQQVGEAEYVKHPIGTGVFKLDSYFKGDHWNFERNPLFWGPLPDYQSLVLRVIPEATTRLAVVQTGEGDIGNGFLGPQVEQIRKNPSLKELRATGVRISQSMAMDALYPEPSPLKDKRVRLALEYAVDRQTIADKVYQGLAAPSAIVYASFAPGSDASLKPRPYDVAQAKKLLTEAGYPNGFKTRFVTGAYLKPYIEAVATYWNAAGVQTEIVLMETGAYFTRLSSWPRPPDMRGIAAVQVAGINTINPYVALSAYTATAPARAVYSYWSDPKLDAMFDELGVTADLAKRDQIIRRIQLYHYEEMPLFVNLSEDRVFALGPKVKSWTPVPLNINPLGLEWVVLNH